jgi:hypothetical protein
MAKISGQELHHCYIENLPNSARLDGNKHCVILLYTEFILVLGVGIAKEN